MLGNCVAGQKLGQEEQGQRKSGQEATVRPNSQRQHAKGHSAPQVQVDAEARQGSTLGAAPHLAIALHRKAGDGGAGAATPDSKAARSARAVASSDSEAPNDSGCVTALNTKPPIGDVAAAVNQVAIGGSVVQQADDAVHRVLAALRAAVALRCSCITTPHRVCSAALASTCLPTPLNTVTPGHPKPAFRSRKQADCPHLGILIFLAARVEWGRVMADRPWHVVGSHVFFLSLLLGNVQE